MCFASLFSYIGNVKKAFSNDYLLKSSVVEVEDAKQFKSNTMETKSSKNKTTAPSLQENQLFKKLTHQFQRSPNQINQLLEGDSELVQLEDGSVLAITVDNIVEEIETGLYKDPYLIGWMTVMVNISDLSAVGAQPIGILLSQQFPKDFPEKEMQEIQKGIEAACRECGTFVLGGDTNQSEYMQSGGVAVGRIDDGKVITRKGCKPGDILFTSGKMGQGSAFAFERLLKTENASVRFQPKSNLRKGEIIRRFGSCCMDSSDGFFAAICNLMSINKKGFNLDTSLQNILHSDALRVTQNNNLPPWIFLAGPHGEFELIFTIPPSHLEDFLEKAKSISWQPLKIGKVLGEQKFTLPNQEKIIEIDPFLIANLFSECESNVELYLRELLKFHQKWQLK